MQKSTVDNELLLRDFGREVSVLKKAHHPNICQFLGCAIDPPTYCVVLEFMQGGSLFEALRKRTVRALTLTLSSFLLMCPSLTLSASLAAAVS